MVTDQVQDRDLQQRLKLQLLSLDHLLPRLLVLVHSHVERYLLPLRRLQVEEAELEVLHVRDLQRHPGLLPHQDLRRDLLHSLSHPEPL